MNKNRRQIAGSNSSRLAESVEQRRLTKGNTEQTTTQETQSSVRVSNGLFGVREAATRDKQLQFNNLMHHLHSESLMRGYQNLRRTAAAGVDRQTWVDYHEGAQQRVETLCHKVHTGKYRALPVRAVKIPKADGKERQLGIAALEDKIVQNAAVEVLSAIYEIDFMGFSYGFRKGRQQHNALDALWVGLTERPINWVLDMDIQGFFDHLQHDWLERFLKHRIADRRLLRLIKKWLHAGMMDKGQWLALTKGSPQGAPISPLLANIYLHYCFDLWAHQWRKRNAKGEVILVRYADDIIAGFEYEEDARRFSLELVTRLKCFGLSLHPEKTRLIEFGRQARRDRELRGAGKPETFDFLGFTHLCSTRRDGRFTVRRMTSRKRRQRKLQELKVELRNRLNEPASRVARWLRSVVQGHYNYFAVPYNFNALIGFYYQISRAWFRALRRRSQKARKLNWEKFKRFRDLWLPLPKIMHPWPNTRFYRQHPR